MAIFQTIPLSEFAPKPIDWLWPPRIAYGSITLLEGDPGLNKSSLLYHIIAKKTKGSPLFGCTTGNKPGAAILLQAEDSVDTSQRNLRAAGADLCQVFAFDKSASHPMLPDDLDNLIAEMERRHAKLLVIDPISAFTSVNMNSDQAVRKVMTPLARYAEGAGVAVILVRHLTKFGGSNALYRGSGSIAWTGACRSSLLVASDPANSDHRVLAVGKGNLSAAVPSLSFRPIAVGDGMTIEFLGDSQFTASQLLEAGHSRSRRELEDGIEALFSILGQGPVAAKEAKRLATDAGIAERTVRRAKEMLRVESKRRGFGRGSTFFWQLPEHSTILDRLRDRELDQLVDQLCHGESGDDQIPDDPGHALDPKEARQRDDDFSDDEEDVAVDDDFPDDDDDFADDDDDDSGCVTPVN